jgi:glycosyltransferase involved in cell wall biosynthesis
MRLSVVIPVYQEEDNVDPLLAELTPVLAELEPDHEIVIVDDGSRDRTRERLLAAAAKHPRLRVLSLVKNAGQSAAFDAGFRAARGALVATMDGDLQLDPRDLGRLLSRFAAGDVDFVYGRRERRADGPLKLLSTRIANGVRNALTGERIVDTGCPLKLFRREVLDRLSLFTGAHRFFITLAHLEGFRSAEAPVSHRPRRAGVSKYGVWNRVFRAWRDCLAVRWMQRRKFRYEVAEFDAVGRALGRTSAGLRESPALERPLR